MNDEIEGLLGQDTSSRRGTKERKKTIFYNAQNAMFNAAVDFAPEVE